MKLTKIKTILLSIIIFLIVGYAGRTTQLNANTQEYASLPPIILWAWERPEDLRFINSEQIGIAFLAQTIHLEGDKIRNAFRQQPLKVSPDTKLIAVTRIETDKHPALNQAQHNELIRLVLNTLKLKNVTAIQIDFDAKLSQRQFYWQFLTELRSKLPDNIPLSITALASFCLNDVWIKDLPIDEAVPMIFRMGTDSEKIKAALKKGTDFSISLCQKSYGIATDEPLEMQFDKTRRLYVFKSAKTGWTQHDIDSLLD